MLAVIEFSLKCVKVMSLFDNKVGVRYSCWL